MPTKAFDMVIRNESDTLKQNSDFDNIYWDIYHNHNLKDTVYTERDNTLFLFVKIYLEE